MNKVIVATANFFNDFTTGFASIMISTMLGLPCLAVALVQLFTADVTWLNYLYLTVGILMVAPGVLTLATSRYATN